MADGNGNGETTRILKLARSEQAAGLQRFTILLGTPLLLGTLAVVGYLLQGVNESVKDSAKAVTELKVEVVATRGVVDTVSQKVEGVDRRVERLEGWRDSFPVRTR